MSKVLGLDLGSNSIGWAIIDASKNTIIDLGIRIFPEGVENLGDGEKELSKNASRTIHRSARRQFYRRRLRKRYLLKILAKNNMLPVDIKTILTLDHQDLSGLPELKAWFAQNPYALRDRALKERITLEELGRVFYHMIQRRGFLSNSRNISEDEGKIFEGDSKTGKIGINETKECLNNKTLGSYLNSITPKENLPYNPNLARARNRYTTRQMYVEEFERIWTYQQSYHPPLTDVLKAQIGGRKIDGYPLDGALFHQRPLRSQKHLVGNCSFEPKKTKCPISALPCELFRIHQWTNDVECNGERLSPEEKQDIINLLLRKEKVAFKQIRKKIGKESGAFQFNYKDDDQITGTYTISKLSNKKFFGEDWFALSQKEQEDIWHVLYFFNDKKKLKEYALDKWGFDEARAEQISKFRLKKGYANLSRKAINNILPFLKMGYNYTIATTLGGIKNAFGEKWNDLLNKQLIYDNIFDIVQQGKKGGYIHGLKDFLRLEYQLGDSQLNKLYHHSTTITSQKTVPFLPTDKNATAEILKLRNPVVSTALLELRKVVNELISLYGQPNQIKIELARDLKVSKTKRNEVRRKQQVRERENNRIKERLIEENEAVNSTNILKYKLWEECNNICPYTGNTISLKQLFSNQVQIEHIFPWSRSLNDSYSNKTLCFMEENQAKGNRTPYEFYSAQSEEKWEKVKQQALNCFKNKENYRDAYQKFKHFVKTKHDDDFISKQLNDTRYISKEAKNYLAKICKDIIVSPGQMTAIIRQKWGLNSILSEENTKQRTDHRHHAIDALVMACINRSHLQEISKWNSQETHQSLSKISMPWDTFWHDVNRAIGSILVSHKKTSNILTRRWVKSRVNGKKSKNLSIAARGQLHKESVYGKRVSPTGEKSYHIRKPIESIANKRQLEKVVDPAIKKLIMARIEKLGGFVNDKDIPQNTFFTTNEEGEKVPQIHLPNKNGAPVPVRKIRISETIGNAEQLKSINQYVNPRNNHHVLIYQTKESELKEDVVSFWKAIERKKQGQPIYQLPETARDGKIITTLQANDMFILHFNGNLKDINKFSKEELQNHLFKVQKIAGGDYFMELCFRRHFDSRKDKDAKKDYVFIKGFGDGKTGWQTYNPIKVKISPAGKITKI